MSLAFEVQIKVLVNDLAVLKMDQIIDMNSQFLSGVYYSSEIEGWNPG